MPRRLARRLVRLLLLLQGLLLPGLMLGLLERMTLLRRQLRHLRHLRLLLVLVLLVLLPGLVHRLLLAPAGIEGVEVHGLQPGLCAAAGLVQIKGEPLASAGSEDAFRRGSTASAAIDSHLGLHGLCQHSSCLKTVEAPFSLPHLLIKTGRPSLSCAARK